MHIYSYKVNNLEFRFVDVLSTFVLEEIKIGVMSAFVLVCTVIYAPSRNALEWRVVDVMSTFVFECRVIQVMLTFQLVCILMNVTSII